MNTYLESPLSSAGTDVVFAVEDDHVVSGARRLREDCDLAMVIDFSIIGVRVGCPYEALTLELGIHPWMHPRNAMRAPGNTVATEATYDDSGILTTPDAPRRINCDPWTGERWPSTSRSSFPNEGQFVYRCFLHGRIMSGGITVSGGGRPW